MHSVQRIHKKYTMCIRETYPLDLTLQLHHITSSLCLLLSIFSKIKCLKVKLCLCLTKYHVMKTSLA